MANTNDDFGNEPNGSGGPGFLTILWRRKALVIFGLVVGLVAGFLFYLQKPPTFQSNARMVVFKRKSDQLSPGSTGGQERMVEDFVSTQEAMLKSDIVWSRATEKLKRETLRMPPANGDFRGMLAGGLKVSRDKDVTTGSVNNVINISFAGPSPEDAKIIVDAVIDGYRDMLKGAVENVSEDTLNLILKARDKSDKDLADSVSRYEKINEQIRKSSPIAIMELRSRIANTESQRADLIKQKIDLKSRMDLIKKGLAEGADRPALMKLYQLSSNQRDLLPENPRTPEDAMFALKLQEEELLQRVGPDHPDVQSLRKRRDMISAFLQGQMIKSNPNMNQPIADPLQLYVQVLEYETSANLEKTRSLQEMLDQDRVSVRQLGEYLITEKIETDKIERFRKNLDNLEERKHMIDLQRDAPLFDANVINPSGTGVKISPILLTTLALGGLGGLVLGSGLAFLAEISDKSFRSIEEVRQRLGLAVIGQVPALTAYEPSVIEQNPLDPNLVVHHAPKSIQSEAYRGVRTSLYFSTRGKGHQVIQVTSPNPGDGKSTLAANLAASIAQSGKRVILLDADFRKPRVHKIFGLGKAEVGLASVIAGEADLESAIYSCEVPGLSILPCGPRPANPADLLTSALFSEILDEIKKDYDFVLIDTPPILAVSDPSVVAPRVDGVILTIRMTKYSRPMAEQAKERLQALGANVLGVVVNGMDDLRQGYGYGYGYGYNYAYAYGEDVADSSTNLLATKPR